MAKSDVLSIDNKALSYAGKVIPIRSIAYFEKYKIKKPYIKFSSFILIFTAIATVATAVNKGLFLIPLIAGLLILMIGIIIIAVKRRKFILILQTTAGDTPRLFETKDENFLDRIIEQLTLRLDSSENLPNMVVNLKTKTINMGDTYENIRGATIINRGLVENSFNTVSHKFDQETAKAIKNLAEIVNKSGNKAAAELFDEFNKELVKNEPRKSMLRSLWDGIKRELPAVKDLVEVAAKIAAIVG